MRKTCIVTVDKSPVFGLADPVKIIARRYGL